MVDIVNSNRNHFNWERKVAKEKRIEAQLDAKKLEDKLEYNLFGEESFENIENEENFNAFVKNVEHFATKQPFNTPNAADILQLNKFVAKYAADVNAEMLLEFFDDNGLTKDDMDSLTQELMECEEGDFAAKLDSYITSKKLGIAQIYSLLNFLYSELKKRQEKKFKLGLVLSLLKDLEQQNSAYLLEYFTLSKHPLIKGNSKLAAAFADLSGGLVSIKNIRQILAFVRDNLSGDYTNLVSRAIQLRMGAILRLKDSAKNYEARTELTEIMGFEKNLILLNTIYKRVISFKKQLEAGKKLATTNDCCQAIEAILGVCEAPMVTEMLLKNFWKMFFNQIVSSLPEDIALMFIRFFQELPDAIFHNTAAQHLKVVEGLRKTLSINSLKPDSPKFSFIRNTKFDRKNYI